MKAFETSIDIKAAPEKVWAILTDGSKWTEWNSTVTGLNGAIVPGGKVTVSVKANPGRAFPVTVAEFSPPTRMVWAAGMPLGLFKGQRVYTLTPAPGGSTRFHMREEFTGLLAPLITKSIPDLNPAFAEFGRCLKKKAEG